MASKNHPEFSSGRTVKARDLQYIQRPADAELLDHCRNGRPAYILHSPQMGKSSLIAHTAQELNATAHHAVLIDLSEFPLPPREEEWFLKIVRILDDNLELSTDPVTWWENQQALPPPVRLTQLITEIILPEITAPLVLFIDEIERTANLSFREHFFEWLTSLYESRATNSILYRLSFVVCGVATPSQLIPENGPLLFQWSHRVLLSDFTLPEALLLAEGLSLPTETATETVKWVYRWTNGHPYLTQLLCQLLEGQHRMAWLETEVDECIQHFITSPQGLREPNFQFVRTALTEPSTNGKSLLEPYLDLLEGKAENLKTNQSALEQLRLVGLLCENDDEMTLRNSLYQEVFSPTWVRRHLHLRPQAPIPPTVTPPTPVTQHSYVVAASLFLIGVGLLTWFFSGPISTPLSMTARQIPSVAAPLPEPSKTIEMPPPPQPTKELINAQEKIQALETTIVRYQKLSANTTQSFIDQRTQLETELTSKDRRLSDLQAQVQSLESTLVDQRNTHEHAIASLLTERDQWQTKATTTAKDLEETLEEVKTLQMVVLKKSTLSPSEAKKLMANRSQLETQLKTANMELALAHERARGFETRLIQQQQLMEMESHHFSEHRTKLEAQIESTESALHETRNILKATEASAKEQVNLTQTELARLQQERRHEQEQARSRQQEIMALNARTQELAATLSDKEQAIRKTRQEITNLEIQANTLKTSLSEKDQARQQTQQTIHRLTSDLQEVRDRESQARLRITQLDTILSGQQQKAKDSLLKLQKERTQLSLELTEALADLATTKNYVTTLTTDLTSTKQDLTSRQVALRDIHTASSENSRHAEDRIAALSLTNNALESRLHKSEETFHQAQQRIAELEEHSEKITGLTHALNASKTTNQALRGKLSSTQEYLENLQATLQRTPTTVPKENSKNKEASTSHEAQIRRNLPLIANAIANPSTGSFSETTRLLWARQAYLFSLQLDGEHGRLIDQALRNTLRTPPARLQGPKERLNALAFNSTGDLLIGGASDGSVLIWSPAQSTLPQKFAHHTSSVLTVAFGPKGQFFASGSQDSTIRLWEIGKFAQSAKLLQAHIKAVTIVAFSPDGKTLASGGQDHSIRLWDLTVDQPIQTILGTHSGPVNSLAFTPNGRHLISAGKNTDLLMWDLKRKTTPPKILGQHIQNISTVTMHPFLEVFASGGPDQPITIWNISQSLPLSRTLHTKNISARHLKFSPNGRKLVSLSTDNNIEIWNWQHSSPIPIVLSKPKSRWEAFAMSPDGLSFAIGEKKLGVTLWSSTDKLVEDVCDKVVRNLSFDEWRQLVGENLPYERTCDNFPIHPTFLEEAEILAKQGAMEKAISIFKRAKILDPYLDLDPKKEVKKLSAKSS